MTMHVQLMTMIAMIVSGLYVGFALDTYRRLTLIIRRHILMKYILEIVFWTTQTGILFFVLFQVNEAVLRVYVFLACLLGYSIYIVIFQRGYQRLLEGLIRVIKTLSYWIYQALWVLLIQPIWWLLLILYRFIRWMIILLWRLVLYSLGVFGKLAKWLLPESFVKNISQIYASCSTMVNKLLATVKQWWQKWR